MPTAPDAAHASTLPSGPPRFEFGVVSTRALAMVTHMEPFPKLLTACAPPGYGKTVLMGKVFDEMAARGCACLWLTLDDRDRDLSALLSRLGEAMQQAQMAGAADAAANADRYPDRSAATDALLHLLTAPARPTVLFIDNLGFCQDPALGSVLQRLVFNTHANLRLVLSSTLDIPIDIARAKLEVGALELRAPHLSFDRGTTEKLLAQAGIGAAGPEQLDRIVAQTEGWPAAIRLLQVLLESVENSTADDIDQALAHFGGDHRDIANVLTRRVLVDFAPELVRFMVEIAQVREFNAELAAEMTGRPEARTWLNQLVARNVLIFPLDRSRRWLRFHTLLREFLLAEGAEALSSARRREVLDRAAHWHLAQGDTATAISTALEAGSTALAQAWLDRIAHVVVGNHGQMSQLIQWVDRLLAAGVAPSPEVHAWFVWALCDAHQYERGRQALADLDRRAATDPAFQAIPGGVQQRMQFSRMLVNIWLDRLDDAHAQAGAWLAQAPATDALTLSTVTSIAAIGEIDRGLLAAARAHMEQATAAIDRADSAYGLAWVAILRACVELGQARPNAADALLADTRERVARVIGTDASVLLTLDFVHARALLDQGRTEAARPLATRGLPRAMHHGIMVSLEQGLVACMAFWGGAEEEAGGIGTDLLDRVAHSYPARGQRLLAAAKIRRLLQLGRLREAQALAVACGLHADEPCAGDGAPMRERGEWMLAKTELSLCSLGASAALRLVDAAAQSARAQERHRDEIELLLLTADVLHRAGDARQALRRLAAAIALAAPGNAVHPFELRRNLVAALLAETESRAIGLTRTVELSFLERLRLSLPNAAAPGPESSGSGTDDPTLREIELLDLLDQGLSNEQVSERLNLSVSTVKWHLHNVYVKLGVRSRSAALARGRSLGLIGRS